MKTGVCLVFLFLVLIGVVGGVFAEVRINEVELNPTGTDSGNEWIELYSDSQVNLTNWMISSNNGRNMTFNANFSGYYLINTSTNLLTNTNNNLILKNDSEFQIFSTELLNDSEDDDRTWQYCSGNWSFRNSTKGIENNCTTPIQPPTCTQNWSCGSWTTCSGSSQTRTCTDTNSCGNTTGKPSESQSCTMPSADTYIQLNWTDEIFSDEEFEIEVDAFNLLSYNYDIKVWLEFKENSTMLSERYDSSDSDWKSGTYYIDNFFVGPGNKTKDIKLRLKEDYQNLDEDVYIYAKLRRNDNEAAIDDTNRVMTLLKPESPSTNTTTDSDSPTITTNAIASDDEQIIVLGGSESKTTEKNSNSIIYKSKMEYIKDYAPYALSVICIIVIILLMLDKKGRRSKEE